MRAMSILPGRQAGTALIMALSILVILTILGISAMKGSTLEYRMATSVQDTSIAFQAAESALAESMSTISLDPNQDITYNYTTGPTGIKSAKVTTSYQGTSDTNVNRSAKPDGTSMKWFHFNQTAVAETNSGATTTIKSGFKQRANAN